MLHCTLRISHVLALFWHTTFDTVHSIPWPRKERIPMSGCTVGIDWYKTYVRVLQAIFLDLGIYGIRVPPLSLLKLIASIKTLSLKNSEPTSRRIQTDTRYLRATHSQVKSRDSTHSCHSSLSNPIQSKALHYTTLHCWLEEQPNSRTPFHKTRAETEKRLFEVACITSSRIE
jgi:hypothetical protein